MTAVAVAVTGLFGSATYAADLASSLTQGVDKRGQNASYYYANEVASVAKSVINDNNKRIYLFLLGDRQSHTFNDELKASLESNPNGSSLSNLARTLTIESTNVTFNNDVDLSVNARVKSNAGGIMFQTAAIHPKSREIHTNSFPCL